MRQYKPKWTKLIKENQKQGILKVKYGKKWNEFIMIYQNKAIQTEVTKQTKFIMKTQNMGFFKLKQGKTSHIWGNIKTTHFKTNTDHYKPKRGITDNKRLGAKMYALQMKMRQNKPKYHQKRILMLWSQKKENIPNVSWNNKIWPKPDQIMK